MARLLLNPIIPIIFAYISEQVPLLFANDTQVLNPNEEIMKIPSKSPRTHPNLIPTSNSDLNSSNSGPPSHPNPINSQLTNIGNSQSPPGTESVPTIPLTKGKRSFNKKNSNPFSAISAFLGRVKVTQPSRAEELGLEQAISKALNYNRTIEMQRFSLRNMKIFYDNAFDNMYLPNINLRFNLSPSFTLGQIPGGSDSQATSSTLLKNYGYPQQSLSLELASYTLFNFWRDHDAFEQTRLDWVRAGEQFKEQVRAVRNQVIINYFRYKAELEKLEAAQKSIAFAEAFTSVVKSQIRIQKSTSSDISSAEVDLLNARINYNNQLTNSQVQLWNLNQLLGDPIGTPYTINEKLNFAPISITPEQALKIYMENAPNMKDKRKDILKAQLNLDIAEKNLLPLPKVTLSAINLSYINDYHLVSSSGVYTQPNSSNFDLSAQIYLTIPLVGQGGLFNHRTFEQAQINLEQANLGYIATANQDQIAILQSIRQILQAESNVKNNKEAFEKSLSILENLSANLTSGSINRLELRDAINNARNFELQLEDSKVDHLSNKLNLAQLIGIDRLPGDPY